LGRCQPASSPPASRVIHTCHTNPV
jgi:hypothetical protein